MQTDFNEVDGDCWLSRQIVRFVRGKLQKLSLKFLLFFFFFLFERFDVPVTLN